MTACFDGIINELKGYKLFGYMVGEMCLKENVKSKTSLPQFMKAFICGITHEAITNNGQSCEEVAEVVCGKRNYAALKDKVILVTGASNGLGLENARVFMKYGAHVIWAVRNEKKAQAALAAIEAKEGKLGGKATILNVDLSDLTTVKPFVSSFLRLNLPLHVLVLNAGIMAPLQWEASKQGFESMFATLLGA